MDRAEPKWHLPPNDGGHDYGAGEVSEGGLRNCVNGCGAWVANFSSGGPEPFGKCPKWVKPTSTERRAIADWPLPGPAPTYIACSMTEPETRIGYDFDILGFLDRGYVGTDGKHHEVQWTVGMSRLYHGKHAYTLGEIVQAVWHNGRGGPLEVYLLERLDKPVPEERYP